ncbi:hypothetical protein ACQ4PT_070851 [Festuca glaucescens]
MAVFLQLGLGLILLAAQYGPGTALPSTECRRKCGNVEIPYSFGIDPKIPNCSLAEAFDLSCEVQGGVSRPFKGAFEVLNISLTDGTVRVLNYIVGYCYNTSTGGMEYFGRYGGVNEGSPSSPYRFSDIQNRSYNGIIWSNDYHHYHCLLGADGQLPLKLEGCEKQRSLSLLFLSAMKENNLDAVLVSHVKGQESMELLSGLADLAKRCLDMCGDNRPSMKDVADELNRLRKLSVHPWVRVGVETEAESLLVGESTPVYEFELSTGYTANESEDQPINPGSVYYAR